MNLNLNELLFFGGFLLFIGLMLALDLGVFSKKSHEVKFREALSWTLVWVTFSLLFFLFLRFYGHEMHDLQNKEQIQEKISLYRHPVDISGDISLEDALSRYNRNLSLEYLTGYVIEYSLSVDNIFVIIMIFLSFGIKKKYYHRILFWGILGAVVMRFLFIFTASALIREFEWILYLFGAFLVYVGGHMGYDFYREHVKKEKHIQKDPHEHWLVKWLSKVFLVTSEDRGDRFWVRENGKLFITPLFIVLVLIEFSDLVFAVDSVPAVFSVTRDPFIVFFSNIFAILGLRSLFFLVMNFMGLRFLKVSLGVLLVFVGLKMISEFFVDHLLTTNQSLLIILSILLTGVVLSLLFPGKKHPPEVNII
jgi:tellurite resistance protein TerC